MSLCCTESINLSLHLYRVIIFYFGPSGKLGYDRKLNVAQIMGTGRKQNNTQAGNRPGGGGGGTLIFLFIRKLRSFWGVQILNFNIFFSEK